MVIENSTSVSQITPVEQTSYRLPLTLGTIITLVVIGLPLLLVFAIRKEPTGSLLSPLPTGEVATTITPSVEASSSPIIAAPNETDSTASGKSASAANADKTFVTLPAGTNELVVNDKTVTTSSYIYIVPISATNDPVSVKTKGEGYFIIKTAKAASSDLLLDYYVVNE